MSICFEKTNYEFRHYFARQTSLSFTLIGVVFFVLTGAIVAAQYPAERTPILGVLAVNCSTEMSKLVGLDFEVFGRVQGKFALSNPVYEFAVSRRTR